MIIKLSFTRHSSRADAVKPRPAAVTLISRIAPRISDVAPCAYIYRKSMAGERTGAARCRAMQAFACRLLRGQVSLIRAIASLCCLSSRRLMTFLRAFLDDYSHYEETIILRPMMTNGFSFIFLLTTFQPEYS